MSKFEFIHPDKSLYANMGYSARYGIWGAFSKENSLAFTMGQAQLEKALPMVNSKLSALKVVEKQEFSISSPFIRSSVNHQIEYKNYGIGFKLGRYFGASFLLSDAVILDHIKKGLMFNQNKSLLSVPDFNDLISKIDEDAENTLLQHHFDSVKVSLVL